MRDRVLAAADARHRRALEDLVRVARSAASVWSRWRESSGTSSGSQMLPPGVSSSGRIWASLMKFDEVGERAVVPLVAHAHERRPLRGQEDHAIAADVHVVLGVARVHVELRRRLGDLLEQELRVEAHDARPRRAAPPARKSSSDCGWSNLMPISETSRRHPRSTSSRASSGERLVAGHAVGEHQLIIQLQL